MTRRKACRFVSIIVCTLFFVSIMGNPISYAISGSSADADDERSNAAAKKMIEKYGKQEKKEAVSPYDYEAPYYYEVIEQYNKHGLYEKEVFEINLLNSKAQLSDGSDINNIIFYEDNKEIILWNENIEWIEWEFDVEKEGLYEIELEYKAIKNQTGREIERAIYIDGELPFKEAGNIVLYRYWHETSKPLINYIGDEVWPPQEEIICWRKNAVYDKMGMYLYPLQFHLTEGKHVLRLLRLFEPVMLGGIKFKPVQKYKNYTEYLTEISNIGAAEYIGDDIKFEAEENVAEKNDQTIRREEDQDPAVSPMSRGARKLNIFGGWRWRKGNQSVTWEFEVPEDGLYNIGIKVSQTNGHGLPVYRRIEIDGAVPFVELNEFKFPYSIKWQLINLGDDKKDYLFYFEKGKHTITLVNIMGSEMAGLLFAIENNATVLSKILQKVFMLTGSEPDPNFDYQFEINIPEMIPQLQEISNEMDDYLMTLDAVCSQTPQIYSLISMCKDYIQLFLSDRYKMASRVKDLQEVQSNLTTVYQELQNIPMSIDYFLIGKKSSEWEKNINSNIFQKGYTMAYNFVRSFYVDYNAVSGMISAENEEYRVLNVWIGRGIEWAEILKNIADETFTPKSNIVINLNIIPSSQLQTGTANVLLLALAAGNAPDVACGVDALSPVEFAIRDAAVDLKSFEGFDEVTQRFLPELLVPFKYKEGLYALPETMDFRLLFYRKDIIDQLGIPIPNTWDELCYNVLPVLYRNNMNFCFAPDYTPFLFQNGGTFYTEDGMRSALDTPEAFNAFNQFTFLYYGYGLPAVNLSFYQKFRTGETPMGISGFNHYMTLLCAAPEISGRWGVAPIPGTLKEDGTIDRSIGGMTLGTAGEGKTEGLVDFSCVILNNQKAEISKEDAERKHKDAWEFLKWWTSYETQARYCVEIESLLGREARWNTANLKAYEQIPWDREHLKVMKEQWNWYRGIPVVLGGYFTSRHITNAWTNVVLSNKKPIDELEAAVKEINIELRRKQEEFGIYADK